MFRNNLRIKHKQNKKTNNTTNAVIYFLNLTKLNNSTIREIQVVYVIVDPYVGYLITTKQI